MMVSCLLQVYFYDTKVKVVDTTAQDKRKKEEPNYFAGIKKMENKQDVGITPFTRANSGIQYFSSVLMMIIYVVSNCNVGVNTSSHFHSVVILT